MIKVPLISMIAGTCDHLQNLRSHLVSPLKRAPSQPNSGIGIDERMCEFPTNAWVKSSMVEWGDESAIAVPWRWILKSSGSQQTESKLSIAPLTCKVERGHLDNESEWLATCFKLTSVKVNFLPSSYSYSTQHLLLLTISGSLIWWWSSSVETEPSTARRWRRVAEW